MSILDWMRSKSPGAMFAGWFVSRQEILRIMSCSSLCLLYRSVRCVVEGVVARCFVVGQRECFLLGRQTDLTTWSAGRAISVVGGACSLPSGINPGLSSAQSAQFAWSGRRRVSADTWYFLCM